MSKKLTAEEFIAMNRVYRDFSNMVLNPAEREELNDMLEEYTQSRLKAIAEEVEGEREKWIANTDYEDGWRDALGTVSQIIQQHLQDDNLD